MRRVMRIVLQITTECTKATMGSKHNQVWAIDLCYLPMAKGFICLADAVARHTRRVLSWRLSVTLDAHFCIAAVKDAIEKYGKPDMINTDQGSQFPSEAFTGLLKNNDIKISMDGKGACRMTCLLNVSGDP